MFTNVFNQGILELRDILFLQDFVRTQTIGEGDPLLQNHEFSDEMLSNLEKSGMTTRTTALGKDIDRLLSAVTEGREDEVASLLAAGTDPNGTDAAGIQGPLLNVAKTAHEGIARRLLAAGAQVGKANVDNVTPLHWAAAKEKLTMARLFLAAGASVHAVERDGWTPLHWAAYRGAADIVVLFLDAGAAVNQPDNDGWTPLHLAAQQGHAATVQRLLQREADPTLRDSSGRMAIDLAEGRGYHEVMDSLKDR